MVGRGRVRGIGVVFTRPLLPHRRLCHEVCFASSARQCDEALGGGSSWPFSEVLPLGLAKLSVAEAAVWRTGGAKRHVGVVIPEGPRVLETQRY